EDPVRTRGGSRNGRTSARAGRTTAARASVGARRPPPDRGDASGDRTTAPNVLFGTSRPARCLAFDGMPQWIVLLTVAIVAWVLFLVRRRPGVGRLHVRGA